LSSSEDEVCPYVGPVAFPDKDLVRLCLVNPNGGTCSWFRVKSFEKCGRYRARKETEEE